MSQIKIMKNDEVLFQGKLLDIPIKEEYIIKKSVEVFDDDDPCIIHKSYVVKQYVDELLKITNLKNEEVVSLSLYKDDLIFLDIDLNDVMIFLETKK